MGVAADLGDTAMVLLLVLVHKLLTGTTFCLQPPRSFLAALPAVLPARIAAIQRVDHPRLLLATSTLFLFLIKNMG